MIEFLEYIEFEKRFSPHTVTSYKTDLSQFAIYLAHVYQIDSLISADYAIIRSWLLALAEEGITSKSIARKIATLRSFYKYMMRQGKITVDPLLKLKAPKIRKKLPVTLTEANCNLLLEPENFADSFSGLRDNLILEILYGTGIRLSELIGLKSTDINMSQKHMMVTGKGNKQRLVPLNKKLCELIFKYTEKKQAIMQDKPSEFMMVTDAGKKTYPMFIYRVVQKYLTLITTAEKKSPHVFRHTFATHLLNKGADLNAIKDLLGHSSLAATQVYTHNSPEKLKAIFDQAHPKS